MKPTIDELRRHVLDLCRDINVHWCDRESQAQACPEQDWVKIAPIRSRVSYATAMHELGHFFGRHQSSRKVMVRERWAWRWAEENALPGAWTPAVARHAREALAWYAPRAAKIDRKWRPPEEVLIPSPTRGIKI